MKIKIRQPYIKDKISTNITNIDLPSTMLIRITNDSALVPLPTGAIFYIDVDFDFSKGALFKIP